MIWEFKHLRETICPGRSTASLLHRWEKLRADCALTVRIADWPLGGGVRPLPQCAQIYVIRVLLNDDHLGII